MNIMLNKLDNLNLKYGSYKLSDESVTNILGMLIGSESKFIVRDIDIRNLVEKLGLKSIVGKYMYDALMRKPIMAFLIPTKEDEFDMTKEELDKRYGIQALHLNNFAQTFSLGCWFIKDSCVASSDSYWLNALNDYSMQLKRDMQVTMSDGRIEAISLSETEVLEAIERMYEIYCHLLPDESRTSKIDMVVSEGTTVWEVDKAISTEGKSFARALIKLQEARRTGMIASKMEKYCSVLECLYALNKEHKKKISDITAVYIGLNEAEKDKIRQDLREVYGVRSDASHGENLKYLKNKNEDELIELSRWLDDYVRRVFRKVIAQKELNYDPTPESKAKVRAFFNALLI